MCRSHQKTINPFAFIVLEAICVSLFLVTCYSGFVSVDETVINGWIISRFGQVPCASVIEYLAARRCPPLRLGTVCTFLRFVLVKNRVAQNNKYFLSRGRKSFDVGPFTFYCQRHGKLMERSDCPLRFLAEVPWQWLFILLLVFNWLTVSILNSSSVYSYAYNALWNIQFVLVLTDLRIHSILLASTSHNKGLRLSDLSFAFSNTTTRSSWNCRANGVPITINIIISI